MINELEYSNFNTNTKKKQNKINNKKNKENLGSATLRQGKEFNKYQTKITNHIVKTERKYGGNKLMEGFMNNYNYNGDDVALEMQTNEALYNADNLISEANSVETQYQELQQLQNQFNTILQQYNSYNNQLLSKTSDYVANSNIETTFKNKNVYVSNISNNASTNYIGCFADTDNRAMNGYSSSSGQYLSFDKCKKAALDGGFKYFGLQDFQSGNQTGQCFMSNDLTATQQYGQALNYNSTPIWSSNTANINGSYLEITKQGQMIIYDQDGTSIFAYPPAVAECASNGGINLDSVQATYGGNCHVAQGNVTQQTKDIIMNSNTALVNGTAIIPVSNATFGDPAGGCPKSFDIAYQCGNVNQVQHLDYAEGQNFILNCGTQFNSCQFILYLQNDGNMGIYKGTSPSNIQGGSIWTSRTDGKQQKSNPNWVSTKGKTGLPYLSSGMTLMRNEWIGSEDGTLMLLMQEDGNLVLLTSTPSPSCKAQPDGNTYGGPWSNAVYEFQQTANPDNLGKMGYLDENSMLTEYPASMIKGENYTKIPNYDSGGNDLGGLFNATVDECKASCNSIAECFGFVYINDSSMCYIKNNNMYPRGERQQHEGIDLYYQEPSVNNSDSCPKDIMNIDSIQWDSYKKTAGMMSPTTLCGLEKETVIENENVNAMQIQLSGIADQILDKIVYLESLNLNMNNQMKIDRRLLDQNLGLYKKYSSKYKSYKGAKMNNVNGILEDSNTVVLQENYSYMLWSILAIGIVVVTINMMKFN